MSKVVFNPTDEHLQGMQGGIEIDLPPNAKMKVPDPTANHLITHLGPRGLVSLEYGDEGEIEKQKVAAAIERQERFERKQVSQYNMDNAKRKRKQMDWVEPTKEVIHYAAKWGMKLEEMWTAADIETTELFKAKKQAREAKEESLELRDQMADMMSMMKELMKDKAKRDDLKKLDKRTVEYKEKIQELKEQGIIESEKDLEE